MTKNRRLHEIALHQYPGLNKFRLSNLGQLAIVLGPNGSGKSTMASSLKWLQQLSHYGCSEARRAIGASADQEVRMTIRTVDSQDHHLCYEVRTAPNMHHQASVAYERVSGSPGLGPVLMEMTAGKGYGVAEGANVQRKMQPVELAATTDTALRVLGNLADYRTLAELATWIAQWQIWSRQRPGTLSEPPSHDGQTNADGHNLPTSVERLQESAPDAWTGILEAMNRVCAIGNLEITIRHDGFGGMEAMACFNDHRKTPVNRMGRGFNNVLVTLMLIEQTPDGGLLMLDDVDAYLDTGAAARLTRELRAASARVQIIGTTSRAETFEALGAGERQELPEAGG